MLGEKYARSVAVSDSTVTRSSQLASNAVRMTEYGSLVSDTTISEQFINAKYRD